MTVRFFVPMFLNPGIVSPLSRAHCPHRWVPVDVATGTHR